MRRSAIVSPVVAAVLALAHGQAPAELFNRPGSCRMHGVATVYHTSLHGLKTASGETYDRQALTAAHRTLPIGTKVLVTNLQNLKQVLVRINDRGPFAPGKMLDLSSAAAQRLGMSRPGKMQVQIALSADALAQADQPTAAAAPKIAAMPKTAVVPRTGATPEPAAFWQTEVERADGPQTQAN